MKMYLVIMRGLFCCELTNVSIMADMYILAMVGENVAPIDIRSANVK